MSTGADNKTMPVTREYESGYEKAGLGKGGVQRGVFVMRCRVCDDVQFPPETRTFYDCHKCGTKDARASIDVRLVKPLAEVKRVDVMTDRYMEGVRALDGVDIGSRGKRREYMKVRELADADDFKETWTKAEKERANIRALEGSDRRSKEERTNDVVEAMRAVKERRGSHPLRKEDFEKF